MFLSFVVKWSESLCVRYELRLKKHMMI